MSPQNICLHTVSFISCKINLYLAFQFAGELNCDCYLDSQTMQN